MKALYSADYKIRGAKQLPDGVNEVDLISAEEPFFDAKLSVDPKSEFVHIDRRVALGNLILRRLFQSDNERKFEEILDVEINRIRLNRDKNEDSNVLLVYKGETDILDPQLKNIRDIGEFSVCLNAFANSEIRENFRQSIQNVIAALSLSLPPQASRRIDKIGDCIYLLHPNNGRQIYNIVIQFGSASASVSSPITAQISAEISAHAEKLVTKNSMSRSTNLLITSFDDATDELHAFISAWSALEIWINKAFKTTYEPQLFNTIETNSPESAQLIFKRFQYVMRDKYRLSDKFVTIASALDTAEAANDSKTFNQLKKSRDELLHGFESPSSSLPTESVQQLLLKYMNLHLDALD